MPNTKTTMQLGKDILEQTALRGEPITACRVTDAHAHIGSQSPFPIYDSSPEGMLAARSEGTAVIFIVNDRKDEAVRLTVTVTQAP